MAEQLKLDIQIKNEIKPALIKQLGDWKCLYPFFEDDRWINLKNSIKNDAATLTPDPSNWFRAYTVCKFEKVQVVFLGLCPYHTLDTYTKALVADGLTFSTETKHGVPPSLFKIYKGIEDDLWGGFNVEMERCNKLDFLAEQGVLLTNVALTTIQGTAGYHTEVWEPFTKFLIETLNSTKEGLIFVGFGQVANKALLKVDRKVHTVIELEHPAASAYANRGWKHENTFSRINELLTKAGKSPILWDKYLTTLDAPF